MNKALLSELIRRNRKAKGLTQAQFAELLNMSEMTIRRWESGDRSPRMEELEKISSVLDVPINELLDNGTPEPIKNTEPSKSPSMAYWGGVLDNAKLAIKSGKNLGIIYSLLSDAAGEVKAAMA